MKVLVEETDVVPFVSRIMDNFQLVAREKNIFFQLENDETSVYLWIDKDKFEKIIFNLLSNAFKYTPANKSVTVRIKTVKEKVQISVIDEGVGIIPQKLETLFQRFETLVSKDMLHMSSGIGLSLVKELVELHHANIEVFSQPGLGSEFMVSFQMGNEHFREDDMVEFILSDDIHYQSLPLQEEAENTDDDSKWSILIVEDSPELLRFLMSILSKEHQVIGAVNGQDGLEKAQQLIPDMIVSDVMMPVMDGLDMVKAIKENEDLCHIPIILLSSKDSLDDRINGLERGIDDYIAKPFNASYLQTRIRYMIRQRIQLQELYLSSLSIGEKLSIQEKLKPAQPQISSYDELFIQHMMDFMEKNMDNVSLSVTDFADAFSMSRAVFYKKTKSLLGISPVDFMKDIRIKRAVQLIDSGMNSFTEVAYMCGFSEPNYFSKCFKKEMGVSPSEYKSSIRKSRQ
jgi:DNA-binding response OmpR family regulator